MQIGESVAETGPEVEQGDGRLPRDTGVAISGTSDHSFEESQHTTHAGLRVERGHEMHLAGARVAKTDFNAIGVERGKK